jgi:hypothetical protein
MWKVSVYVHDCGGTQKNMACRTRHSAMWKVSVCVHDCGGTQKNMACRTRHGAGVRGSAQCPHVAPRPARCGGLQQQIVAAPACHPAPGRTGVAAVLRPACC